MPALNAPEPTLSVIISALDQEAEIARCLDSLTAQKTRLRYECLVMDGGPDDAARAAVEAYRNRIPSLRVVSGGREGAGRARNLGLEQAVGKFVWFIDGSDYLEPDALDRLEPHLTGKNQGETPAGTPDDTPDVLILPYRKAYPSEDGFFPAPLRDGAVWKHAPEGVFNTAAYPEILAQEQAPWNKIFRKKLLDDSGIRFAEDHSGGKWLFTPKALLKAANIRVLPGLFYNRIIGGESLQIPLIWDERRLDALTAFAALDNYLTQNSIPAEKRLGLYLERLDELACLARNIRPQHKETVIAWAAKFIAALAENEWENLLDAMPRLGLERESLLTDLQAAVLRGREHRQGSRPLLSILLPVGYPGPHLEACLQRLENQDLPESYYELLIIHDSQTALPPFCTAYAQQHANTRLVEISGIVAAAEDKEAALFRQGLERAKGSYVALLRQDIMVKKDAYGGLLLAQVALGEGADIVFADAEEAFLSPPPPALFPRREYLWNRFSVSRFRNSSMKRKRHVFLALEARPWSAILHRDFLTLLAKKPEWDHALQNPYLFQWLAFLHAQTACPVPGARFRQLRQGGEQALQDAERSIRQFLDARDGIKNMARRTGSSGLYQGSLVYTSLRLEAWLKGLGESQATNLEREWRKKRPTLPLRSLKTYRRFFPGPKSAIEAVRDYFASRSLGRLAAAVGNLRRRHPGGLSLSGSVAGYIQVEDPPTMASSATPQPDISIIIPVYNAAVYLDVMLNDVRNQTVKNIEILCIDDGSTDDSAAVLEKHAGQDSRLTVIRKENGGAAAARNAGIGLARGEYITFLDADDRIAPQTCEMALAEMRRDPELDVVVWGGRVVSDIHDNNYRNACYYHKLRHTGKQKLTERVAYDTPVTPWNKLYKLSIIKKYHLEFPGFPNFEDNAFWWKYAAHAAYGFYLNEYLYDYIQHSSSLTGDWINQNPRVKFNSFYALEDIAAHYRNMGLLERRIYLLSEVFAALYVNEYIRSAFTDELRPRAMETAKRFNLWTDEHHIMDTIRKGRPVK